MLSSSNLALRGTEHSEQRESRDQLDTIVNRQKSGPSQETDLHPRVSVIIPTTCELKKFECLSRAVNSVLSQRGVDLEVVVVCNGPRVAREISGSLKVSERLRWIYLDEGNVSKARYAGLVQSRGEFFCFLDDDDELLEGSLECRVEIFEAHPDVDVVVTNGMFVFSDSERLVVPHKDRESIHQDGLMALTVSNWIGSAAPMFRGDAIWKEVFNIDLKYFEWTYIFFDIYSRHRNILFQDIQTYLKNESNDASVSHSVSYLLAESDVLSQILGLPLPDYVKHELNRKLCRSLNVKSGILMDKQQLSSAWAVHFECLMKGGYQYLSYTRHLLRSSLRRLFLN